MAIEWTGKQKEVIDMRDANILVSAAAGSGKTAVLVQRIIEKIMDETHPVNIDQFVIVTFTRAAAGEMRDRIQSAIEREAALYPENAHLQRQRTRIHMANISTIHGFCTNVIRNHFQEIDLDPAFRVGDEGEFKLMRKDVLAQVLEEYYEEGSEEFLNFAETFSTGKTDDDMEDVILDLYHFAMSFPYPEEWFEDVRDYYKVENYEQLKESAWMVSLTDHISGILQSVKRKVDRLEMLVGDHPDTIYYQETVSGYREMVKRLLAQSDYEYWYGIFSGMVHPKLPLGKKSCPDEGLREEIKSARDALKTQLDNLKDAYFQQSPQQVLADMANCKPVIDMLIQVTKRFMERFKEEKRERNLLDYNDLEHEALHILRDEDGNPTETAREYAEFYEEILIDEYQDSNLIQEYLLTAVSKTAFGGNNLFMVGDAKQSIYRFRLARPELFMEKFNRYSTTSGNNRRIDLHRNFRSRKEVLDGANYIFGKIMKPSLGEIDYNEDTALYNGMTFPPSEDDYRTEVLIFDKKKVEVSAKEYEAKMIAHRIKKLVSKSEGLSVVDKKTGQYRKARYSDIVILLRSTKGFDTILTDVLAMEGIPAHTVSKEGYFDTLEVVTVLNYLRIIDNPFQDVPLLSVLKSPIVAVTDEELAKIRIFHGEDDLYTSVKAYGEEGEEKELQEKLCRFLEQLQQFRQKMYYVPVHDFIAQVLDETGYGDYIRVMPGGEQRRANLNMLIEKASAFEKTSYTGVFQFVRYVEQLQKYEVEMGEASIQSENENTVRIMTIHKSKGLEFPIVFVAGMGRDFNRMDERKVLATHATFGVGIDSIFLENRVKSKSLYKKAIQLRNRLESMGEELRVLYVALTRAKEKLILTGSVANMKNTIMAACEEGYRELPSYAALSTASCYLAWVLMALAGHVDMRELIDQYVEPGGMAGICRFFDEARYVIREVSLSHMMEEELEEMAREERLDMELDLLKEKDTKDLPENLRKALEYVYPHHGNGAVPAKVSVSELKHAAMILDEEEEQIIKAKETEPIVPSFILEKEEKVLGSDRGTAYHTVFEKLDLCQADTLAHVREQMEQLYETGMLEPAFCNIIRPEKVFAFASSPIGKRMKEAQIQGKVHKEQPFVFALPARELDNGWDSGEPVMIQGIIDVYFEEDDGIVLLDYKTDYVKSGNPTELIDKYKTQLDFYKKALESLTGKRVKESVLYSTHLEQEIVL